MVDALARRPQRIRVMCPRFPAGALPKLRQKKIWISLALPLFLTAASSRAADSIASTVAEAADASIMAGAADQEPITPIPSPPIADPRKVALGERLFEDRRLSRDGGLACVSCHDIHTNGAGGAGPVAARDTSKLSINTPSVFNAALSFRLNWEGNLRTLEAQTESALENPVNMNTSVSEVLERLKADPDIVNQFREVYQRDPDRMGLLDAVATYERSLLTPGSRFDRWLGGEATAITAEEQRGYRLFKSFGCISCHQGVNVGGNLFERSGIFRRLAGPGPEFLRVPSLRNVATRSAYFHDGSAATLDEAVRRMGRAQLNRTLSDEQIKEIVAFLLTLTGNYRGAPVRNAVP
jgi:cytochrome c peroxidase